MVDNNETGMNQDILLEDCLYLDNAERTRHVSTLKALAEEINAPVENIAKVYENLLMQYKRIAVIHEFLPVLVSKRIRNYYRIPRMQESSGGRPQSNSLT